MIYWFTSDFHEGHANILKYCSRPFKDIEEQHTTLVRNFNERIKDEDVVIHVGDFCFRNSPGGKKGEGETKRYLDYLKDYKGSWIFTKGNHDGNNSLKTPIEKLYINYGGHRMCVTHSPNHADEKCYINLVGHVHEKWKIKKLNDRSNMINVGIDVWNFRPVSIEEILRSLSQWKKNEKEANKN